jgi:hypothetical protein
MMTVARYPRLGRVALLVLIVLTVEIVVVSALGFRAAMDDPNAIPDARVGADYQTYMSATRGWLDGRAFYPAAQTSGPYTLPDRPIRDATLQPILYPPTSLVLFVPFALAPPILSVIAWYAIPLLIVIAIVWSYRPRVWAWPVIAWCAMWTQTIWLVVSGNPAALWATAAVALGTKYGWPALGVLLRPTLAPLALIGIHRRSWWIAAAVLAVVNLPLLGMWSDYVQSLLNLRGGTPEYVLQHYVVAAIPLVAWLARSSWPRVPEAAALRG